MELLSAFLERIREITGEECDAFLQSLDQTTPVSLRVNPLKRITGFDSYEKVPWASDAYYLPERISFTLDPSFHAGCYYVQEASSMYLETVFRECISSERPLKVLDLCAAPGGKSTHLLSLLPEGSLLVSNEVIPSRNNILRYNLEKWGSSSVIVTQSDPSVLGQLSGFFDVIVVDAPCSGEGMFRKDPVAVSEWNKDTVAVCSRRQQLILDDIFPALKQDGILLYSTCTYEYEENEMQVAALMADRNMELIRLKPSMEGIVESSHGLRFFPHRVKGEGFFISALRKVTAEPEAEKRLKPLPAIKDQGWLNLLDSSSVSWVLIKKENDLYAIPENQFNDYRLINEFSYVRKAGIWLGELKGTDLIPSHELALSIHLSKDVPRVSLSMEEAIRYLKCETISVSDIDKGWAVVTYSGFPIGWIKSLGNRINNYFPKNQRILKG